MDLQNRCFPHDSNIALSEYEKKVLLQLTSEINRETEDVIGLKPISTFYLKFNDECNLTCEYCFLKQIGYTRSEDVASPEVGCRAVEVMRIFGAQGVGIHGGEPLIHFGQLSKLILAVRERFPDFQIGLSTNGTLVDDRIASFLEENHVYTSVELDGGAKNHNLYKRYANGAGSYADTIRGIDCLIRHNALAAIECTIGESCGTNYDEIAREIQARYKNIPITVSRARTLGRCNNTGELAGEALYPFLLDWLHESMLHPEDNIFTDSKAHLLNLAIGACAPQKYMCDCILDRVSIDAVGNVYPCPKCHQKSLFIGNVFDPEFSKLFMEAREVSAMFFSKNKVSEEWYSNLLAICIDTIDTSSTLWKIKDREVLGEYFEELIYRFIHCDVNPILRKWLEFRL